MKRIISLLLVIMMLCSCSNNSSAAEQPSQGSQGTSILPVYDDSDDDFESMQLDGQTDDELWIPDTAEQESQVQDEVQTQVYSEADFDVNKLRFEDFDNLYGQVMYEGVPEGRVPQPLKQANGLWRYNLKMRFDSSENGYMFDELGYAEMSVNGKNDPPIVIVLHPRLAAYDGYEVYPETDEEVGYEPFKGTLDDDNEVRLYGNDLMLMPVYFYAYEGREYFIAHLYRDNEFFADFLMIRGQE